MSLQYHGSQYTCRGNQIFKDKHVFISRIIYQCSKCNHFSQTIAESDEHYSRVHHSDNVCESSTIAMAVQSIATTSGVSATKPKQALDEIIVEKIKMAINLQKNVVKENKHKTNTKISKRLNTEDTNNRSIIREEIVDEISVPDLYDDNQLKDFNQLPNQKCLKTYSKQKPIEEDIGSDKKQKDETIDEVIVSNLVECKFCGQHFNSVGLSIHLNLHLNPHICSVPFCEQMFATEKQLKNHIFDVHERDRLRSPQGYQCPYCDRKYVNERDLNIHSEVHTNPKTCDVCGKSNFSSKGLLKHKKTHNKEYKYRCIPCNKSFPYYSNLMTHKRLHTNPWVCDHNGCGKKFASKAILTAHSIKHSTDRPYQCDYQGCHKRFKRKSYIEGHKNIAHLNVRPFGCPDCDKTFGSKVDLRNHVQSRHTDKQLKFICDWPECDKKFAYKTELKRHHDLHTGVRPYVCDVGDCDKNFASIHLMNAHKKSTHQLSS